jgi:predicted ATPase
LEKEIVVITGGPGTGKTTLIDALIEQGYSCFPEISRQITLEAKKQGIEQLFLEKPLLFSELLLEGRKKQYQSALQDHAEIVFLDRGIPDILAYMHYIGDSYPAFLTKLVPKINIQKFLFYHHGKKSMKVMKHDMKILNKPN